jgi:hypothetical protein
MWGRGLRSSPESGKEDCILLDHSGNILRFAEDYTKIFYEGLSQLDMGEKLDKVIRKEPEEHESKGCPSCGFKPFKKRCMSCGFEIQLQSEIQQQPGEMNEIKIGSAKAANSEHHLWQQVCAYARFNSPVERQQGRAAHIYKDISGSWPPSSWSIDSTQSVEISRAVMNKIKSKNIAFSRANKGKL